MELLRYLTLGMLRALSGCAPGYYATLSSATTISVNDIDLIGTDRSTDILTWDDDGATTNAATSI